MLFRNLEIEDYNKGFIDLLSQLTTTGNISFEEFKKNFEHMKELNNIHHIVVICYKDRIIGTGTLVIEPKFIHKCSYVGHIEDIVIDNKYRGQNLGKKMVEHLKNIARQYNCYKIILNCSDNNVKFYENCGFKKTNNQMSIYFS